jgi:hypothetical protein
MIAFTGDGGGYSPISPRIEGKSDENDESDLAKSRQFPLFKNCQLRTGTQTHLTLPLALSLYATFETQC